MKNFFAKNWLWLVIIGVVGYWLYSKRAPAAATTTTSRIGTVISTISNTVDNTVSGAQGWVDRFVNGSNTIGTDLRNIFA